MLATKEQNNKTGWLGRIVCLAAALLFMTVLYACGGAKGFSVQGAVLVTAEGYDGAGKLNVKVDQDELGRIIYGANTKLTQTQIKELTRTIEVTPSAKENLSNGQTVTFQVRASQSLLDQLKLKLTEDSWVYNVTDLREIETIDPFASVEVSFTGISPNLSVQATANQVNSDLGTLYYALDGENTGLAIGDSVTLKVVTEESEILKKGYRLSSTEKTYTIDDNHDQYITSPDQLDEAALARLKKEAEDLWTAELNYSIDNDSPGVVLGYDGLEYVGTMVLIKKNGTANDVDIVLRAEIRNSGKEEARSQPLEEPVMVYFPVVFDNVIRYADGAVSFEKARFNKDLPIAIRWGSFSTSRIKGYLEPSDMMTHLIRQWTADWNYALDPATQALFDAR